MATEQEQLAAWEEVRGVMDEVHHLAFIALPLTFLFNKGLMVEFRDYCKVFSEAKKASKEAQNEAPTDREIIEDVFQPYRG